MRKVAVHPRGLRLLCLAALCLWTAKAAGNITISELLADNENGIVDEDGDRQDWLELYNSGDAAVSLDGWWLTDKAGNKTQWRIPDVSIAAKGTLFVWASGKNRSNPASPLHANFGLSKDGEYLGLYKPDPATGLPVLVDEYASKFPALPADVSYGRMSVQTSTLFVAAGEVGRYRVPPSAAVYTGAVYSAGQMGHDQPGGWNLSPSFDDSSWAAGATGIGYDTTGAFDLWMGETPSGNCSNALYKINTSLCFRRTFYIPDTSLLASVTLRMKYEDGFVAFVNGVEVGRANCTNAMAYNTRANTYVDESVVSKWSEFAVSNQWLVAGTNLLAVQGLNSSSSSSDFLLLPEVAGLSTALSGVPVYFAEPTPGALNGVGSAGPLLCGATPEDPDVPRPLGTASSPPLTVAVRVIKTKYTVAAVRAVFGPMWAAESNTVALLDDGVAPDVTAGDGVYSAALPTENVQAGQMFRWRFEAQDVQGTVTRLPAFLDALDSPQYFGTVAVSPTAETSRLPVLEWFVKGSPTNGPSSASFRGSCYYLTNFYDNIEQSLHGQSTRGFTKKSYNFNFNSDCSFLRTAGERRVKGFNLLSNYADKTKARNTFSHWVGQQTGTPHHYAFPVRVQLNGVFHGVLDVVEDGGDRMLERNGLDPEGALYKIYGIDFVNDSDARYNAEKKTRKDEDNSDLRALTNGLNTARLLTNRLVFAYDNVDLAATVNYLVTRQLNSDGDHGHKNFYLYRDTNGTREWQPIIWDVDLSQGHNWNSAENYFDDDLVYANPLTQAAVNRLYSVVYETPEMRQMFVRRMRTLMDELMQAPGTTNGLFEAKMREIVAAVDPDPADPSPWTDGDLDAARWGFSTNFVANRPREEVERVIANYVAPRRAFLFNKGAGRPAFNGVYIPDAAQANVPGMVMIDSLDFLPAENTQSGEYVILRNTTPQAVDLSGWRVGGEISHVFKSGTVIPAGSGLASTNYIGLLHLVKDARAFRARTSGPTGGQRRFVQGNYRGQLSARGGTVNLYDGSDTLIASMTYAGAPVPAQLHLRITEIQYHPAEPTAEEAAAIIGVTADDFEYLELANTGTSALTLTGDTFSQGIGYTFPTSSLAGGARLVLAKNPAAFALRYPLVSAAVYGPYEGALDNAGERLELTDVCGENILDFEYKDGWYPASDGSGRALALRDAAAAHNAFGDAVTWGLSGGSRGTPGEAEGVLAQAYYGWDNFHFSEAQREDPLVSGPFADPDGDGRLNWVEYALSCDPWAADAESVGYDWVTAGAARVMALRFQRPRNAIDVTYALLATGDLVNEPWSVIGATVSETSPLSEGSEGVALRESSPAGAAARFYRLLLSYGGE